MVSFHSIGSSSAINQLDKNGKRTGYWVIDEFNHPLAASSAHKWKEGNYSNGRKEGVWIFFNKDGKTPRLIGEFADNRPSGAYFRFNLKGELVQASSVPKTLEINQSITAKNAVFSCKLNFDNKETVAGQVYFSQKIIKKNAIQFWVEKSLQAISSESKVIDFTWLNANYDRLYARYLEVRSPQQLLKVVEPSLAPEKLVVASKNEQVKNTAKKGNYLFPPAVRSPRLAKGLSFQPNGLNKLYTPDAEIWMDGYFKGGQLQDGKVFIYDTDGVLLKVRVYKNGLYESDGVL
jgi:hypothetical protein